MSILHGSWILQSEQNYFFVWGEAWRSLVNVEFTTQDKNLVNPFCLPAEQLVNLLNNNHFNLDKILNKEINLNNRWLTQQIAIPSVIDFKNQTIQPIFSKNISTETILELSSWQVEGFYLTETETIKFLQSLPLNQTNNFLGGELNFWSQIYRWILDLIVRGKFLPGINSKNKEKIQGNWQPLLDSIIDQARLAKFIQLMPSACLNYQVEQENLTAQELLLNFLSSILDANLRNWIDYNVSASKNLNIQPYLLSLSELNSTLDTEQKNLNRLENALYNWTLPIQEYLVTSENNNLGQNQYHACFTLQPPSQNSKDEEQNDWQLKYFLQALDNANFIIDAEIIWQHDAEILSYQGRTIPRPQEIFLKGLGLASRIYQPIADSLQTSTPQQCNLNPIQVYEFLRSIAWQLQDNGLGVILPPGLTPGENEQRLGVQITAEVAQKKGERLNLQSLLKYKLEISVGNQTVSKQEFEKLLAQKSPVVEINGQWLALQPADVKAAQAVLNQANEAMNLSVEDALRLSTGDTKTLAKLPVVSFKATGVLEELINNLTDNKSVEPITNIPGFIGELRPYQARGVGWLAFLEKWGLGACLADDMGLGKTPQLIGFVLHLKENYDLKKPILVICPTSVLNNWEREVKKFAPTLSTLIHHGDHRSKGKTFAKEVNNKHLVITSYSLVHRDLETLKNIEWEGIVLDEAQNIKNSSAKQSQAVRQLPAKFRIALTGTPVENRLSELWSILDFLNPSFLGTRAFFQKRFAIPIEKYGDRDSLKILRSLVQPFILRRLKTDKEIIQDLPEKQEMNVFCGLSSEQAQLYQQIAEESLVQIESSEGIKRRGLILTLLLRLKQLCNHPELLTAKNTSINPTKNIHQFGNRSGKLLRLEEMLEELMTEGDRALIFTQFSEWGKLLKPYLETKLKGEVLFLYGATRRQQRQEMIDRFQNDPNGPQIFILSLKAGGTGLNLTRANHVFHVDRWWNPAVENQATDRAFRIGQKRNVQVHKFISTGTLEEKINDIIESKKELAEQTVDAGENWLTELDTNQLRNLLLLNRDSIIDEE
ncbi:SNF2-related protein [Stanieria cyanosphaera PCC 7437]|uniref:SNF2-related protein n=1 Tax=Stanieria cyanosphaera (strain ATCC 29371 / PCC 7437) TaxID=111780 RepID=K9XTV8_STAC7|nr:DEAD/DEAH box helicase [Stanieria cyanosphaera]AFZ35511.1 SNF2-related protein [Stanieria cyanosphaera PCC 7437]